MTKLEDHLNKLFEEIVYHYEQKRRLHTRAYVYLSSDRNDKYLQDAAKFCADNNVSPAVYVDKLYDNFGGKKAFFGPKNLQAKTAKKHFDKYREIEEDFFKVELNNNNLDYDKVWQQQLDLATDYLQYGYKIEDILKDAKLKFFAWFRVLATTEKNQDIIHEYIHIAKKELNPRLLAYLKQNKELDIGRIL
jgi:hypothetical protein